MATTLRWMPVLMVAAWTAACAARPEPSVFDNPCSSTNHFAGSKWKLPTEGLHHMPVGPTGIVAEYAGLKPIHVETGHAPSTTSTPPSPPPGGAPAGIAPGRGRATGTSTVVTTATTTPPPPPSGATHSDASLLPVRYGSVQQFADTLHRLPPQLADFADTNNWCTANSPEFQDAQRFLQSPPVYGPLAQSLSNPSLAEWKNTSDFESAFRNVAVIYLWPDDGTAGAPYKNLGLVGGINCVYLAHSPGATWHAKILPITGYHCDAAPGALQAAPDIPVAAEDSTEPPGTVPPVTRFVQSDEDMAFLGVRCGARWCDVGGDISKVPHSITAMSASQPIPSAIKNSPQLRVKGWWDEQRLAIGAAGNTPPLRPNNAGAIVPVPGLARITTKDFQRGYRDVAYAYVDAVDMYATAFGMGKGWNRIQLRDSSGVWQALIFAPRASQPKQLLVGRVEHTIGSLPGTARWDWTDVDEWIWISCDLGCCLIDGGRGLDGA